MRIASIDIGTNTVLLLIADVDQDGTIHFVHHEQRLPRLGRDVDRNQIISVSTFDRIEWILNEYRNLAQQFRAELIVTCGTSAVRDASNKHEFLTYMEKAAGLNVEILSGDEEARWTYRGAISGLRELIKPAVVVDIGGGSTEISFPKPGTHNGSTQFIRYSLQVGSVRLTER